MLNYWPEEDDRPEGAGPLRYLAVRVRKRQGHLFADGSEVKYFAVASNQWDWSAKKLLEWHREKAGSIEALHDVLKNELAAGVCRAGDSGLTLLGCEWRVDAECADRSEAHRTARAVAHGTSQATAVPDFLLAGKLVHHARRVWCG